MTPVHLFDDRRLVVSPWSRGNPKLGEEGMYTFSLMPVETCPGASDLCKSICYARRAALNPFLRALWEANAQLTALPPPPADCHFIRLHVSGDFPTTAYVDMWTAFAASHPTLIIYTYTRSWRIPALLPALERLRALPNVQLFASTDESITETPPEGWRVSWIEGDPRVREHTFVCAAERGVKPDCLACGYCFCGTHGDVVFLKH